MVLCRMHCAVDLEWGEAETMAMKKTWPGCEKQPSTSITSEGTVPKMVHGEVDVETHSHMSNMLSHQSYWKRGPLPVIRHKERPDPCALQFGSA